MGKGFLSCAIMPIFIFCAAIAPVGAQTPFPWPPELSAGPSDQPAATEEDKEAPPAAPAKKPRVPPGPDVAGNWKGELTQIGESKQYKLELVLGPQGGANAVSRSPMHRKAYPRRSLEVLRLLYRGHHQRCCRQGRPLPGRDDHIGTIGGETRAALVWQCPKQHGHRLRDVVEISQNCRRRTPAASLDFCTHSAHAACAAPAGIGPIAERGCGQS